MTRIILAALVIAFTAGSAGADCPGGNCPNASAAAANAYSYTGYGYGNFLYWPGYNYPARAAGENRPPRRTETEGTTEPEKEETDMNTPTITPPPEPKQGCLVLKRTPNRGDGKDALVITDKENRILATIKLFWADPTQKKDCNVAIEDGEVEGIKTWRKELWDKVSAALEEADADRTGPDPTDPAETWSQNIVNLIHAADAGGEPEEEGAAEND